MSELYEGAQNSRVDGALAAARRRVGRYAFSTVVRVLAEIGTGRFVEYAPDSPGLPGPTTADLLERALGIDRARVDSLANSEPWYQGDSAQDLARLGSLLNAKPLSLLAEEPDAVLAEARDELRAFLVTVLNTSMLSERLFGRAAFGFGLIGRALRVRKSKHQAVMLLGWLALREDPELRHGMSQLGGLAPVAEATVELHRVIGELREEVPPFAEVLSEARMAKALKNAVDGDRLDGEIAAVRDANKEAVDAFFRARPEIDQLIIAASGDAS
ncbi:MAG TPA: hypothetical protein VGO31_10505 [Microbacteriaceae bacterium]|jgi:hypothetical protein|nr:hypothetical protein [Microbacteriaceae bacterium]